MLYIINLCYNRHHQKEVPQEDCVPREGTVHRVQKPLSPALLGNTAVLKETRNLMTVSHVTQGMYTVNSNEKLRYEASRSIDTPP